LIREDQSAYRFAFFVFAGDFLAAFFFGLLALGILSFFVMVAEQKLNQENASRLEIFATFTNAKSPRSLRPTWMRINYLDPELNRVELFSRNAPRDFPRYARG